MKANRESVPKLLKALAEGEDAKLSGHDIIFKAAVKLLEEPNQTRYLVNLMPTNTRAFLTKEEARLACMNKIGVLDNLVLNPDYSVRCLKRSEQKEIWEV